MRPRTALLLALTACVDPVRNVWIEADPTGIPLPEMENCPGDTCVLTVLELDGKPEAYGLVTGEGVRHDVVLEGNESGSMVFQKDSAFALHLGEAEVHGCLAYRDEMVCERALSTTQPAPAQGILPDYTFFLREGMVLPRGIFERD